MSLKFKGNLFDASGVYDENQQKTQSAINAENAANIAEALEVYNSTTAGGAAVSFEAPGAFPIKALTVGIELTQEGSGTPSTTNIRPIVDHTGCNIYVSPTQNAQDGETYTLAWTDAICAGTVNVINGAISTGYGYKILTGAEDWKKAKASALNMHDYFYLRIGDYNSVVAYSAVCSHFVQAQISTTNETLGISIINSNAAQEARIAIRVENTDQTSLTDFTSWLAAQYANDTPVQVCYELAAPSITDIERVPINTLSGQNHIWADCGDVSVTYGAYLEAAMRETSHWNGKLWYAYGTSLTTEAQGHYASRVAEYAGMRLVNRAVGGGALVANRNIYNRLISDSDGKQDADLITIEVGANDASTPLGDPYSLDTDTFCGALNVAIRTMFQNGIKAQVVLMPSIASRYPYGDPENKFDVDRMTAGGWYFYQMVDCVRKIADNQGCYFIPFNALGMGRNRENGTYGDDYCVDNIHPTSLGGYNLAQGVWSYLRNIPLWYTSLPT